MTKDKEKKEPIVNEEYEDLNSSAVCCDSGKEPDACCSGGPEGPGNGKPAENRTDGGKAEEDRTNGKADGARPPDDAGDTGNDKEKPCCGVSDAKDPAIAELEQKLEEAAGKRDEYLSLAQRVQADFDNYKRRNKNAIADSYNAATADVAAAFLPVLDNLERAIDSAPASDVDESVRKGVEMVKRQFLDTLTKLGVEEIDALGKPFDPELHNAVGQVDGQDGQEENTVAEVLQKGYRMGGKVIRYSMVHVVR